jgi:hypothetical protein
MANIKKSIDQIDKSMKDLAKTKDLQQAMCPHTHRGDLVITRTQTPGVHRCTECQKLVKIKNKSQDELNGAIDVLDSAIDIVKMMLNVENDEDKDLLKKLGKFQYRLNHEIVPIYNASINKGNKNKKKNKNRDDNGGWNKPVTY